MQTSSTTDEVMLRGSSRGLQSSPRAIETSGAHQTHQRYRFRGRSLTVRYDRFPDYNNPTSYKTCSEIKHHRSPNMLGNLGYERNTIHHRLSTMAHFYQPLQHATAKPILSHSSSQLSTQPSTVDSLLDTPTPKLKPRKPSLAANSSKKTTRNHHKPSRPRARAPR